MSSIDKRIVELEFENKNFEKGIKDSKTSLKDFDNALNTTGRSSSLSGLGSIVTGLGGKFSALGTIGVGALLSIGNRAVAVGEQLIKSLAIDTILSGFSEYELKMNSIKVMLAGGRDKNGMAVSLEMVNRQLEMLNTYSDKTIYSFSDMTRNIGKFTNAGIDLETSVMSIQGISNAAALSGANAEEAARAMYNFAQALSAGYVKFIDWRSIENANMATMDFKIQLMDTAVEMGTLEKAADGYYKVLTDGGMEELITPSKMFNQSLEKQWMTSEVLTATLTKYADETTEIGKKATEAATKVRTFSQLMDTTKESIQSGWAMSAEYFFGNFEQAAEIFTGINNALGSIIQKSSDTRNSLLKDWGALKGRQYLIDGLSIAWKNLSFIVGAIKGAFTNIFPPITVDALVKITRDFNVFMKTLTPSISTIKSLKIIFKGLFSVFSLVWGIISSVFKGLFDGLKNILSLISGGKILGFLQKIALFFINLNTAAKKGEIFVKISKAISSAFMWIGNAIKWFINAIKSNTLIKDIFTSIGNVFSSFVKAIGGLFVVLKNVHIIPAILEKVNSALGLFGSKDKTSGNTNNITKFIDMIKNLSSAVKEKLAPVGEFISTAFKKLQDSIEVNWKLNGFEGLLKMLKGLVGAGIGVAIAKFVNSLTGLSKSGQGILSTFSGFGGQFRGILSGFQGVLKSYQDQLNSKKLLVIAGAIALLVASIAVLTLLDEKKMLIGIGVITALFSELTVATKLLSGGGSLKGMTQLMVISSAVLVMSGALSLLQNVDPKSMYALTVIIGELVATTLILSKAKNPEKGLSNLIGMAMAIDLISVAVLILSKVEPEKLKTGISAISILLGELLIFSLALGKAGGKASSMLAAGIILGVIAGALLQISGVVLLLGAFNPMQLAVGLGGIAGIMLVMAAGVLALANPKVLFGAAAMIILAGAITLFVPAIVTLGLLPIKTIVQGLLALAGIFAVLGIAGLVLGPVLPVILGVSAAVALLGAAMLAAGIGMMLFGVGLTAASVAGLAAVGVLIAAITGFVSLIPFIATKVGEGIVALAVAIGKGAPALMIALGQVITAFLTMISTKIPEILITFANLITSILTLLVAKIPEFVNTGMLIILGFLTGISNNIGPIIETVAQIIINMLNGISAKIPEFVVAATNLLVAFLDGISQGMQLIIDKGFEIVINLINGITNSINENMPLLIEAVNNLGQAMVDALLLFFGVEKGSGIAGDLIAGLRDGINNGLNMLLTAVNNLGKAVLDAIKAILGIKSPSSITYGFGEYLDEGLANGLANGSGNVIKAAKKVGNTAIDAMSSTIQQISDAVNTEINSSPVISPVLDLNGITSGASTLSNLLSTGQTYGLAKRKMADDAAVERENQNGSNSSQQYSEAFVNNFNLAGAVIRSDEDITKLSEKILRKQENMMRSRGLKPATTY